MPFPIDTGTIPTSMQGGILLADVTDDHAAHHRNIGSVINALSTTFGTTPGTNILGAFGAGNFAMRINTAAVMQTIPTGGTMNNMVFGSQTAQGGTFQAPTFNGQGTNAGTISGGVYGTAQHTGGTITSPTVIGWDGWVKDINTWSYSSVDGHTSVVTVNADVTGAIQAGYRIKFTNNSTTFYGIVSKTPTFGAGSTTITIYGGINYAVANSAITAPFYSPQKSPFGFNTDPTQWTERITDSTDRSQASAVASTWYNLGTTAEQITIPIGLWVVTYNVNLQQNAAAVVGIFVTLSTANNSETDSELSSNINSTAAFAGGVATKTKTFSVAAKTTYFLNTSTSSASSPTIYNRNSTANGSILIIEARCAYL